MIKRDIGQEILDGLQEIKAFKKGDGNLRIRTLTSPAPPQVAKSGRSRTVIPGHAAHRFRSMSHSESGVSRTL
ncbi:MAG: transcriptional regulator [Chloroflexi bacterium HGW-Chloroflexi-5]|nr:MAG: transcriptional regulator [Chloroflexi bacterium HGW-Chloroflexi-5]